MQKKSKNGHWGHMLQEEKLPHTPLRDHFSFKMKPLQVQTPCIDGAIPQISPNHRFKMLKDQSFVPPITRAKKSKENFFDSLLFTTENNARAEPFCFQKAHLKKTFSLPSAPTSLYSVMISHFENQLLCVHCWFFFFSFKSSLASEAAGDAEVKEPRETRKKIHGAKKKGEKRKAGFEYSFEANLGKTRADSISITCGKLCFGCQTF